MNASSIATIQPRISADGRHLSDRDELLQASRRVDWRFLLPHPDLTDTAVVAGADPQLVQSIRSLGIPVTILDSANRSDCLGRFSVVVACTPNGDELVSAVQAARCGGSVYVEIDRRRQSKQTGGSRTLRSLDAWLQALRRLHVTGLQVHWHWPNFASCTDIVPLGDRAAGVCTLRRRGTGSHSRWKARFAAMLLHTGWLPSFVPCLSVLGQRFRREDSGDRPSHSRRD